MNYEGLKNYLPVEAYIQLVDVYCEDTDKEFEELTKEEIIRELKWKKAQLEMDIGETNSRTELEYYEKQKKSIEDLLDKIEEGYFN